MKHGSRSRLREALALSLALVLLAASCSDDNEDSSPVGDASPATANGETSEVSEPPEEEETAATGDDSPDETPDSSNMAPENPEDSMPSEDADSNEAAAASDEPEPAPAVANGEPIRVGNVSSLTGKSLTFRVKAATLEDDPTPLMLQARDAGCEAVIVDGVEPHALAVGRTIDAQDLNDIVWIGLTSYYTDAVAQQLGRAGNGLQANSEFEPYGSDSPDLDDWKALMTSAGVPLTSFAQGGYLAGTIFAEALLGIEGEITRESVAEAMRNLQPYETPLLGTPYTFGIADAHAPN